jgi:hypothetical protein
MGKNRGEERCEVDSGSLLAQFGQRVEARSIPRFVVFDDCLAVAISACRKAIRRAHIRPSEIHSQVFRAFLAF